MSNLVDIILIGGGAYYIANRLGDNQDDDFKRILIGAAVGVPAALKGPEIYDGLTGKLEAGGEEAKNKALGALFGGAAGYLIADQYGRSNNQNKGGTK